MTQKKTTVPGFLQAMEEDTQQQTTVEGRLFRPATYAECQHILAGSKRVRFEVGNLIERTRQCSEVFSDPPLGAKVIVTQVLSVPMRFGDDPRTPAGAIPMDIAIAIARECTDPRCPVGVHVLEALVDSRDFDLVIKP